MIWESQKLPVRLEAFHDVADIAGTETEGFGSDDDILGAGHRVAHSEQKIRDTRADDMSTRLFAESGNA